MAALDLFNEFVFGGEPYILQVIEEQREEGLYLDFKRGAEVGGKQEKGKCTTDDRNNLARVISGFANSDGGIAVWGVDRREGRGDSPSVAQSPMPITNVQRFQNDLLSETSKVTSGAVGVDHRVVKCQDNPESGYVITYVPKAEGPPVMALGKDMNCYWFRSGDSFRRMEPFMVADRFSRRPQPQLKLETHAYMIDSAVSGPSLRQFRIDLVLSNTGVGTALYAAAGIGASRTRGFSRMEIKHNQDMRLQRSHREFPSFTTWEEDNGWRKFDVSVFLTAIAGDAIHPGSSMTLGHILLSAKANDNAFYNQKSFCKILYELYCEGFAIRDEKEITVNDFQH